MNKKVKKILKIIIFCIPFILGTIGLSIGDEPLPINDAMFYTFNMYFMCYGDSAANILVEIARWMAPVILISEVVMYANSFVAAVLNKRKAVKGGVAVYCDPEDKELFKDKFDKAIFVEEGIRKDVQDHLVLKRNDVENIQLANEIASTGGRVYAQLREVDSFLMEASSVHYFNKNEIIARHFWKENSLENEDLSNYKIGIIGFGNLSEMILKYGLMYNIYSLDQSIEYNVYLGKSDFYGNIELFNNDKVSFHEEVNESLLENNRIIFGDDIDLGIVQNILYNSRDIKIFYHADEASLEKVYAGEQIKIYGNDIYSNENIMTGRLYKKAMELNYNYECLYGGRDKNAADRDIVMEKLYNDLSGFLKGSNLAACDYHEIRKKILVRDGNPQIVENDKYVQMEHLRWSRFHLVNHWKAGNPKDKAERDRRRIHSCLVDFNDLSEADKGKDYETIKVLMN